MGNLPFLSLFKEIIKFLITGGLSALITLAVLNLLLFFGYPIFMASTIGYGCGILNSFILNKKWTFRFGDKDGKSRTVFAAFILFNLAVMLLFGYLNLGFFAISANSLVSQFLSICITTTLNFLVYKYILFKK